MDSLRDIISKYSKPEPPELLAIKQYVDERYHAPVRVTIHGDTLVITVASAALANTLRLEAIQIKNTCNIEKRLVFRIG